AYVHHNQHPNVEILTQTRVIDIAGQAGDFTVVLRQEARHVDPERCINCGRCAIVCPVSLPSRYQRGMTRRKAAYKVAARAAPDAYVIDRGPYCDDCGRCVEVCPTSAVDLGQQPRYLSLEVGAIILALGFSLYDPAALQQYGYGRYPNVIDAMQYERLASRSGPTEGLVTRPSDSRRPRSIAWLQCIGSRDQTNNYCSSICCMYGTKEAILAKQRLGPGVDCSIFMMDERAFNKEYSLYFARARDKHGIHYYRCRVSSISEDSQTHNLIIHYAEPDGNLRQEQFEMVILAIGLQPPGSAQHFTRMLDLQLNEHGFCKTEKFTPLQTTHSGVFVCGAFSAPKEISETILDASGAAAEVMRLLNDQLNSHPFSREWPFLMTGEVPLERDVSEEAPRVGVFVCTCGKTMSDTLDMGALTEQAAQWPGVATVKTVDLACFSETLEEMRTTITALGLNRVVVAACSNRTHESLFQRTVRQAGLNPYLLELVNLRDHCKNVHLRQPELANRKAAELLRVALARVSSAQPVHKTAFSCDPAALIIGGGLAGMTAALAIADSGHDVHLVERSDVLGGNLQDMYYVAEGYNPRTLGRDLINRVRAHPHITTCLRTELVEHGGHVGQFWGKLRTTNADGSYTTFRVSAGATIVATGAREAREHPLLSLPQVITQRELEEKVVHCPEEIAQLRSVVMIQCVRPEGTPEYCSRVCCTNMLKNAIRLRLFNPNCQVTVLYKNIVTYGFREEFYTEARRLGVVFVRYEDGKPPQIVAADDGVLVRACDLSLGRWLELPADLVPLSMAIVPSLGTEQLSRILRVPLSSEGFFAEAQIKLRPMDFMREGVFLAGMAHYPKFIEES
ncbi:MAG TPA: FAD-dependent oxidoreductase, partial [Candidatus Binatia bacterium]|nr:FAD-dependent oxidoreductase [Candidatus Binatia bacterium]